MSVDEENYEYQGFIIKTLIVMIATIMVFKICPIEISPEMHNCIDFPKEIKCTHSETEHIYELVDKTHRFNKKTGDLEIYLELPKNEWFIRNQKVISGEWIKVEHTHTIK